MSEYIVNLIGNVQRLFTGADTKIFFWGGGAVWILKLFMKKILATYLFFWVGGRGESLKKHPVNPAQPCEPLGACFFVENIVVYTMSSNIEVF